MATPNEDLIGLLELQLMAVEQDAQRLKEAIVVIRRRGWEPPTEVKPLKRQAFGERGGDVRSGEVRAFILNLLNDNPDRRYGAADVWDELHAIGWEPPVGAKDPYNSICTSLGRMCELGQIVRVGRGVYMAAPDATVTPLASAPRYAPQVREPGAPAIAGD
jgi:hypothetical protein